MKIEPTNLFPMYQEVLMLFIKNQNISIYFISFYVSENCHDEEIKFAIFLSQKNKFAYDLWTTKQLGQHNNADV